MIINPIWFYLIDLSDKLYNLFIVLACVSAAVVSIILSVEMKQYYGLSKKLIIVCIVMIILSVLLPDKETGYQMLVASQVTTDNVNNAIETIKNCVDYIVEAMNKWLNL